MTLEETNQIDIGLRAKNGQAVLVIVDAGTITDPDERFNKFLEKLKVYVHRIMGEDFQKDYPGLTTKDVFIYVLCTTPPTEAMKLIQNVGPSGDRINRIQVRFTTKDRLIEDLPQ